MSNWLDVVMQFGTVIARVVRSSSGEEIGRIVPHSGYWIAHNTKFVVVGICPTQEEAVKALTN